MGSTRSGDYVEAPLDNAESRWRKTFRSLFSYRRLSLELRSSCGIYVGASTNRRPRGAFGNHRLLATDADAMEQGNLRELLTRKRLGESRCMPPGEIPAITVSHGALCGIREAEFHFRSC